MFTYIPRNIMRKTTQSHHESRASLQPLLLNPYQNNALTNPSVRSLRQRQGPKNRLPRIQSRPQSPRFRSAQTRNPHSLNHARHTSRHRSAQRHTRSQYSSRASAAHSPSLPNHRRESNSGARSSRRNTASVRSIRYRRQRHDNP